MFTNRYIFTYASIMVILVAAILSTASMVLKPYQEKNIKAEKIQGILISAEIEASRSDAEKLFDEYIVEELAVNKEGDVISIFKKGKLVKGDVRPFDLNLKEQLNLEKEAAKGKSDKQALFPLYIMNYNGKQIYVVPVRGMGLWGPIWGNIAFGSDFNTITGAKFDHKGETPGLGAEISTNWFGEEFKGKTIFNKEHQFVSIAVVKGGVANSNINLSHGVDAISGGTITSNGVTDMLKDCLKNYVQYIDKNVK